MISLVVAVASLIPLGPIQETFHDSSVKVAGDAAIVVGLRRGEVAGPLDIETLAANLPARASGELCVEFSTQDGRYSASKGYRIAGAEAGVAPLRPGSQLGQKLALYTAERLAAKGRMRAACEAGGASVLVPIGFPGMTRTGVVVLALKTQATSPTASFLDGSGRAVAEVRCEDLTRRTDATTAYDHRCRFEVPEAEWAQVKTLKVKITGLTGSSHTETYPVDLGPF